LLILMLKLDTIGPSPVDRIGFLPQSVAAVCACGKQALKRALLTLTAVVVGVLLLSLVVLAASDWRSIGQTEAGDKVSISSVKVLKSNQRLALVRVEYKEPTQLPQGGPFVEMRARVRFNCSNGSATPTSEWFYTRDHSGRFVVSKKAVRDDEFGQAPEHGFADLVSKNVCAKAK
jgi:hypothetical protein